MPSDLVTALLVLLLFTALTLEFVLVAIGWLMRLE